MRKSFCSVSVDLDTLRFYYQIHGLVDPNTSGPDPIYTLALPRLLDLFDDFGIRATFFVIGQDVEIPAHCAMLKQAVQRGHELANHSYYHPYRLTQLPLLELQTEISMAEDAINSILPATKKVCGFRCPGYNIHPPVLQVLRQRGYLYDSSVFPSAPYYLAKGGVMAMLSVKGTPSRSMLGSPQVMWAPTQPYKPGKDPHRPAKAAGDIWEIPMAVMPFTGLPLIGTSVLVYPKFLLQRMTRIIARRQRLLNFELHGIDLIDPTRDPGLRALIPHQPDLRVSLKDKRERFGQVLEEISKTHQFLPLVEAIEQYDATRDRAQLKG